MLLTVSTQHRLSPRRATKRAPLTSAAIDCRRCTAAALCRQPSNAPVHVHVRPDPGGSRVSGPAPQRHRSAPSTLRPLTEPDFSASPSLSRPPRRRRISTKWLCSRSRSSTGTRSHLHVPKIQMASDHQVPQCPWPCLLRGQHPDPLAIARPPGDTHPTLRSRLS